MGSELLGLDSNRPDKVSERWTDADRVPESLNARTVCLQTDER